MPEPVLIVGSGAAAAGAALSLCRLGVHPTLLGAGDAPGKAPTIQSSLHNDSPDRDGIDLFGRSPSGRLAGTRAVYIGDAAGFSGLPAKNMSFAIMANAMRIAAGAAREA